MSSVFSKQCRCSVGAVGRQRARRNGMPGKALVVDANVKVVSDPSVEIGGCVVDAGPCRIDAQVGPALRRARELISELYRRPDAGEGEGER